MFANLSIWSQSVGGGSSVLNATLNKHFVHGLEIFSFGKPNPKVIVSDAVQCQVIGGTPPYTYLWEAVSNPSSINITAAVASSTTFNKSLSAGSGAVEGIFRCKVTDSVAAVTYSESVQAELEYATNE